MRENSAIRIGAALLSAALLCHTTPAMALYFYSPLGTIDNIGGVQSGLCGQDGIVSQFTLTMPQSFRYETDDSGGRDFYDYYLLDGTDRIIDGGHGYLTESKPTVDMNILNVQTEVMPDSGPFRFVIVDTSKSGQFQADGAQFNQSVDASITVDLNQLNPVCPPPAKAAHVAARRNAVAQHVNAASAVETVKNIQRHLSQISAPGGTARADHVATPPGLIGQTDINPFSAYARLRPEIVRRLGKSVGHNTQRDAMKTMLPYLNSDSASKSGFFSGQREYEVRGEDGTVRTLPSENPKLAKRSRLSVWLNGSVEQIQQSSDTEVSDAPGFDGDTITVSAGADAWLTNEVLTGVSVSYGDTFVTVASQNTVQDEISYGVSPYILVRPNDWLDLSAQIGLSTHDIRQTRKINAEVQTQRSDAISAYLALNATASSGVCRIDGLRVSGGTGFLHSIRRDSAFDDAAPPAWSEFARISGNGEIAYTIPLANGIGLEPYVSSDLRADLMDRIENDRLLGEVGGGLRYTDDGSNLRASLDGFSIVGLNDDAERRLNGNLSFDIDTNLLGGGLFTPGLTVATTMDSVRTDLGVNYRNDGHALSMEVTTYITGDYSVAHGSLTSLTEREKGVRLSGHLSF